MTHFHREKDTDVWWGYATGLKQRTSDPTAWMWVLKENREKNNLFFTYKKYNFRDMYLKHVFNDKIW